MKKFNILCLTAAASLGLLTSCSSDISTPDEPSQPESATFTISLVTKDGSMNSRALDTEAARENERLIHDAILLLYDKSINSSLTDADVVKYVYFGEIYGGAETLEIPITDMIFGTYYATVIVNVKDKSTTKSTDSEGNEIIKDNYFNSDHWFGKKLSDIRDEAFAGAPYTKPWSEELSDYDHYVMVSDLEVKIDFSTDKPKIYEVVNGIAKTTTVDAITVERLSARVDLKIEGGVIYDPVETEDENGNTITTNYYKVNVYDLETYNNDGTLTSKGDYLNITSLYLYNINQVSTYFIERSSTQSTGGTITYFGDEGFGTNYATAYVQSPSKFSTNYVYTDLGWDPPLSTEHPDYNEKIYDLFSGSKHILDGMKTSNTDYYYTITYIGEYTYYDKDDHATMAINFDYYDQNDVNLGSNSLSVPILHCKPETNVDYTSKPMAYAVIRNTIYRFYVRFLADTNYLYVRWYYYSEGTSKETFYTEAKFSKTILSGDGSNIY